MGKQRNQTTQQTTKLDPQTQGYLDAYRNRATGYADGNPAPGGVSANDYGNSVKRGMESGLGGISAYTNPYDASVVSGVQGDFQHQRELAANSAADMATKDGAYGGSRSAILSGVLQGDVNRNEASTLANVRQQGFQNATGNLMADRSRQAALGMGGMQWLDQRTQDQLRSLLPGLMGGTGSGQNSVTQMPYNDLNSILGLLIQGGSMFVKPGGK